VREKPAHKLLVFVNHLRVAFDLRLAKSRGPFRNNSPPRSPLKSAKLFVDLQCQLSSRVNI